MGVSEFRHQDGAIHFRTSSADPAIGTSLYGIRAGAYKSLVVRMKMDAATDPDESGQIFWASATSRVSEPASVRFRLIGGNFGEVRVFPFGKLDLHAGICCANHRR